MGGKKMIVKIEKCSIGDIEDMLTQNIRCMISPIDSYLEDHILKSQHFKIMRDSKIIGYFSIFEKELLTQFYLEKEYRSMGQEIFDKIRRYENIQRAYIPTCDEFFLSHGIDYSKRIETQAYFFQENKKNIPREKIIKGFSCKLAKEQDIKFISEQTRDFFNDLKLQIKNQEIYIGYKDEKIVSFGVMEKSKIHRNIASIGMFTISGNRQEGIGRNTLLKLKEICHNEGMTPIAGCWYYNHNSKKTLESAGMYSQTRLLVIHL